MKETIKQDVFFPDPIDLTFCPLSLQELFKWPTPVALFVDILQATRVAFFPFLKSSKYLRVSVFTSLLAPLWPSVWDWVVCNVKSSSLSSGGDRLWGVCILCSRAASLDQPETGASLKTTSSLAPALSCTISGFSWASCLLKKKKKSLHTNPYLRVCLWKPILKQRRS